MSWTSALLALPILGLVSIPLILSAWVTVSFALITLCLRLAVVYIELGYALLVNFFTVPMTTSSLLNFAASQPGSPVTGRSRRNSGYGLVQSRRSNDSLTAWALIGIHDDLAKRKKRKYARSMIEAHDLSTEPYFGLPVSGDEWRDFEGVGGWRSYHNASSTKLRSSQSLHDRQSVSPSSSVQSIGDDIDIEDDMDADERAWLSINNRLELPSQVVTLGAGSTTGSMMNSPTNMGAFEFHNDSHDNSLVHRGFRGDHLTGNRHHQRSHTTSSLTASNPRTGSGLSLSLSTRPDHTGFLTREYSHPVSPSASRHAPFMTPQPYTHTYMQTRYPRTLPVNKSTSQLNSHRSGSIDGPEHTRMASSASGNFANGSGGYFALQRPDAFQMPSKLGSPGPSEQTTPISPDDRGQSPLQLTRLMAHYPTSVRHRRRSIPGLQSERFGMGM